MRGDRSIRIVIADDHPVVREGLRTLVSRQRDMVVVAEAATGRDAVDHCIHHKPDIALIDLRMPELSGIEAIAAIRARVPSVHAIVLTTFDGDEDIYRSLRAGAKAYLLKDAPRDELLSCIRAVHEGKTWISPLAAANLTARLSEEELTPRETEVLRLIAAGKSNKEIAEALFVTEGTIKLHVNHILRKLKVSGRSEAIPSSEARHRAPGLMQPKETSSTVTHLRFVQVCGFRRNKLAEPERKSRRPEEAGLRYKTIPSPLRRYIESYSLSPLPRRATAYLS